MFNVYFTDCSLCSLTSQEEEDLALARALQLSEQEARRTQRNPSTSRQVSVCCTTHHETRCFAEYMYIVSSIILLELKQREVVFSFVTDCIFCFSPTSCS